MAIEIVSSHEHGHLCLPEGEVMAASKFDRMLGNWVELNNKGDACCIKIGNRGCHLWWVGGYQKGQNSVRRKKALDTI